MRVGRRGVRRGGPSLMAAAITLLMACSNQGDVPGEERPTPIADPPDAAAAAPWTVGVVTSPSTVEDETALVTALRTGQHEGFERVVFELSDQGRGYPGYTVQYVDQPLHECGSGREIHPVGDAWLEIRLDQVDAHTQEGQPTVPHDPQDLPGLENVQRAYMTCDYEAVVTVVLAVGSPNPFRVFHLDGPRRIVVDVRR